MAGLHQAPMISCPLKTTQEIDWVTPLKNYIRVTYGDPEKYNEECATLNRLRQDMRGAGKDSAAGRDLLYRYYGQLELLDLRFPVDENHIKISFTWYDAFTHKQISQYSLAYEKASIIFNISAVLSCHAANQNRSEDAGLKTAYHSFQASAGMFTYINENFLHAPSSDLSRETVRTLINIMLAQAQEVFLEKQIGDGKKPGMLAKLAAQAGFLYSQAAEGCSENTAKEIFSKFWLGLVQAKMNYMGSIAQYYQALHENTTNQFGIGLARMGVAERLGRDAVKNAGTVPSSVPANSNLVTETSAIVTDMMKRHLSLVQEKRAEFQKDNDYIYHHTIPSETSLSAISKLPASKAIPVQELYAGQDIQRIIGPDIFSKIVPMSVTESASLYDEEKAKLIRAETEKCDIANSELAAALDYLKLPGSLKMLKGGFEENFEVDPEFRAWADEIAAEPLLVNVFDELKDDKLRVEEVLMQCAKALDTEEAICEKMRSKYMDDWVQQPSLVLTQTLREDIKNLSNAIDAASESDAALLNQYTQYADDIEDLRVASEKEEVDVLFQKALVKNGYRLDKRSTPAQEGSLLDVDDSGEISVMAQIERVEELLKKLNLIKRERMQVLKDLKEKVHNDDINHVLILNKKAMGNIEGQLFASELEKFRPHQNRLLQATHKQQSLMKDLTAAYGELLQDKRVRAEQSRYEKLAKNKAAVVSAFKKVYRAFLDIQSGLDKAKSFYGEMKDTVDSLDKNVDVFVNNRRQEGANLLAKIEKEKGASANAEREQQRIRELMEKMSVGDQGKHSPAPISVGQHPVASPPQTPRYGGFPQITPQPQPQTVYGQQFSPVGQPQQYPMMQQQPQQQYANGQYVRRGSSAQNYPPYNQYQPQQQPYNPGAYVPPPPPGPPPMNRQQSFPQQYPPQGYSQQPPPPQQQAPPGQRQPGQQDPWSGLQSWR
ncbi:bck1-like resistance to osmotic shock [Orbilia oligospora]|nr:bck1-like resistance to osmotic shock [Orbilia oligospora]KAF3089126.1 bck1-like resistance to osmotic shock, variant 2 [Orbilia oligospora]KAF3090972.1 bck1-like resistance to osmotic shock [Orbilia oligospora]KAF3102683.1 bck1-like resistance to osmotic shock [Orbilia oligospora]KAF3124866.1 bck1-like resistance to osmotic shock [Orbilia oligospora]